MSERRAGQDARTPEEVQTDIARTRLELTSTVDELVDRLDPRVQVAQATATIRARAQAVKERLRARDPKTVGVVAVGAATTVLLVVALVRRTGR